MLTLQEVVEFQDPSQRRKRGSKRPREGKVCLPGKGSISAFNADCAQEAAEEIVADNEKYQVSSDFDSIWKSVTELGASKCTLRLFCFVHTLVGSQELARSKAATRRFGKPVNWRTWA